MHLEWKIFLIPSSLFCKSKNCQVRLWLNFRIFSSVKSTYDPQRTSTMMLGNEMSIRALYLPNTIYLAQGWISQSFRLFDDKEIQSMGSMIKCWARPCAVWLTHRQREKIRIYFCRTFLFSCVSIIDQKIGTCPWNCDLSPLRALDISFPFSPCCISQTITRFRCISSLSTHMEKEMMVFERAALQTMDVDKERRGEKRLGVRVHEW